MKQDLDTNEGFLENVEKTAEHTYKAHNLIVN